MRPPKKISDSYSTPQKTYISTKMSLFFNANLLENTKIIIEPRALKFDI